MITFEIWGVSLCYMRRWKKKYEQLVFNALFDGRRSETSPRRVPSAALEEVLRLHLMLGGYLEKQALF